MKSPYMSTTQEIWCLILLTVLTKFGLSQQCTYSWTVQYGRNVPGLTQQGVAGTYTEDSCKAACQNQSSCLNIDYNTQDKTCWFGYTSNPTTSPNSVVNHETLTRSCPGVQGCYNGVSYTWTPHYNQNSPGLVLQGSANSYTEDSCKSACLAKSNCWSVDWNSQDKTCFHGTQQNPTLTSNQPVNHWDLSRGGSCSTVSPSPTPSPTTNSTTCVPQWTEYQGQNVLGLVLQGAANSYTEQSCLDACFYNSQCQSIDYNTQDKTCWFGYTQNPGRTTNTAVNHYDLLRVCPPPDNCYNGVYYTWTPHYNQNSPGLVLQGSANSYTEDSCKSACLAKSNCWSVDWNSQDKTCFHGTQQNPTLTSNQPVNHWDLSRGGACGVSVSGTGNYTPTPTPGCTNTWLEYTGQNAPGLTQKGTAGSYNETTCKAACERDSTCYSIDYNFQDSTCFFGYTQNPTRRTNIVVDHWDLTRNCPYSCGFSWTVSVGMNAPGLEQQGSAGSYTEESCKSACLAVSSCWSCDYNTRDNTCFFGYTQNPTKVVNSAVDHWDLTRSNCTGATSASSALTTLTPFL